MTLANVLQIVGVLALGGALVLAPLWFAVFVVAVAVVVAGIVLEVRARPKVDA